MKLHTQHRFHPISNKNVKIKDCFWSPRLDINRRNTIPFEYHQCKNTGRIDAFHLDWETGKKVPHIFWDSDVAKWIEAASYSLHHNPDSDLEQLVDQVIELIASAQQKDGYLNIYYTAVKPEARWTDLEGGHELYCAGHMIEGAVAYFQSTGKRKLLDVVCRYADYIDQVFGKEPAKLHGYPGHPEIELALVKLYRVTNEERYLRLSEYFVNERGQQPNYFENERKLRNQNGFLRHVIDQLDDLTISEYHQSHQPVREQNEAVGHSVRAMYLYSAMADLAYELKDESLYEACKRLWNNLAQKRMYITGGIGSAERNEGFTYDYDLPNLTSYSETCAAIGLVFWNHRLVQLECDGRYTDLLERALYNAVLAGVSLDGRKFFYANPLESQGEFHRSEWFDVACCPPNIARLLASLGEYIYSQTDQELAVHLFIQSNVEASLSGQNIRLHQETSFPWDSTIKLTINTDKATKFGLNLRIPGWAPCFQILINNEEQVNVEVVKGYAKLDRVWENGDQIELILDMPVVRTYAHPNVRDCVGKVAIQRGPIVYCLEEVDNKVPLHQVVLPEESQFHAIYQETLLDGVVKLIARAIVYDDEKNADLYRTEKPKLTECQVQAIPYFAWDNRAPGSMAVWIREQK